MEATNLKISVVIPTCHRNDLLAKCLDCLIPGVQTLPADYYEVIVTDDGSISTAEELIKSSYPWAKWTQGPKRGPAANRNHGANFADGEWIAFTDDDCLPTSGWLAAFSEVLTGDRLIYEGKTTCKHGLSSSLYTAPVNETGGFLWSCNMLISKSVFNDLGRFDETFPCAAMEDVDFREHALESHYSLLFVDHAVVDHPPRWRGSSFDRAKKFESYCAYCAKRGKHITWFSLLYGMSILRMKEDLRNPGPGLTVVRALAISCGEVSWLLRLYPMWKKKYPSVFKGFRTTRWASSPPNP